MIEPFADKVALRFGVTARARSVAGGGSSVPPRPSHSSSSPATCPPRRAVPLPNRTRGSAAPREPPAAVLPDKLMLEILAWLPVKSLCRCCKCVSSAWHALISDSDPANRRRSSSSPVPATAARPGILSACELVRVFGFASASRGRYGPLLQAKHQQARSIWTKNARNDLGLLHSCISSRQ